MRCPLFDPNALAVQASLLGVPLMVRFTFSLVPSRISSSVISWALALREPDECPVEVTRRTKSPEMFSMFCQQ
jgi:hypothetical protein